MILRASYVDENELQKFLQNNQDHINRVKRQPAKGKFKRAYIEMKDPIT